MVRLQPSADSRPFHSYLPRLLEFFQFALLFVIEVIGVAALPSLLELLLLEVFLYSLLVSVRESLFELSDLPLDCIMFFVHYVSYSTKTVLALLFRNHLILTALDNAHRFRVA